MRVDFINDVEQARQQATEHGDGPHLERFRQQRVIRVRHRVARNVPGLVPIETVLVQQQSHELGDRDRRVRIIELEAVLLGKRGEIITVPPSPVANDVLEARRRKEVLLA